MGMLRHGVSKAKALCQLEQVATVMYELVWTNTVRGGMVEASKA